MLIDDQIILSMHYKFCYTLFLVLLSLNVFSQTKKIAYKSHSGNKLNYYASANPMFESPAPDFGLGPTHRYFIESVEVLNDSSLVITRKEQELYTIDSLPMTTIVDTMVNWYYMQEIEDYKSSDSIKSAIIKSFAFENSPDSIEIFYKAETATDTIKSVKKNKKKEKEKHQVVFPITPLNNDGNNNNNNNNGNMLLILIGSLLSFSVLLGIFIKRFAKKEVEASPLLS